MTLKYLYHSFGKFYVWFVIAGVTGFTLYRGSCLSIGMCLDYTGNLKVAEAAFLDAF